MSLEDDVRAGVTGVLAPAWNRRNGQVVPKTDDVTLRDGAVDIEATYLYADMADSTGLAQAYKDFAVAKVIRCYLNAASRLIKNSGTRPKDAPTTTVARPAARPRWKRCER